jgi:hypothetical protein
MASNNQGNQDKGGSKSSGRGFASMDPERRREIASQGGKAAHEGGKAHEFSSEEARQARRKVGQGNREGGDGGGGQDAQKGQGNTPGGTSEQHAQAGRQSHKNDK